MLLHFLLVGYASNWPGSRGHEKDCTVDVEGNRSGSSGARGGASSDAPTAQNWKNSVGTSAFGLEIREGLVRGSAADRNTAADISQIAYTGKHIACMHYWF